MSKELIEKKLEQITQLLAELSRFFEKSSEEFLRDAVTIRAAERDFQLIVDIASDLNAHILVEKGEATPDTYRQSFINLGRAGILPASLANELAVSARLRNILVHEYDFEEDVGRFYVEAKRFVGAYGLYLTAMREFLNRG